MFKVIINNFEFKQKAAKINKAKILAKNVDEPKKIVVNGKPLRPKMLY